jgi:hypothetical protein
VQDIVVQEILSRPAALSTVSGINEYEDLDIAGYTIERWLGSLYRQYLLSVARYWFRGPPAWAINKLHLRSLRLLQRVKQTLGHRRLRRLPGGDRIQVTQSSSNGDLEIQTQRCKHLYRHLYIQQAPRTSQHTICIVDNYRHQLANQSCKLVFQETTRTHLHSPSASHSQPTSHYSQHSHTVHRPSPV